MLIKQYSNTGFEVLIATSVFKQTQLIGQGDNDFYKKIINTLEIERLLNLYKLYILKNGGNNYDFHKNIKTNEFFGLCPFCFIIFYKAQ